MSSATRLAALQAELVDELRAEYFCEDLAVPDGAFGWTESRLREYFESAGGEAAGLFGASSAGTAPPADPQRPVLVLIGDSQTDYSQQLGDPAPPHAMAVGDPQSQDAPSSDIGPGWASMLVRDYAATRRADVLNRGFSGYTTRFIRADLEAGLLALPPTADSVLAVTIMLGSNDQSEPSDPLHVPVDEYKSNLLAIVANLSRRYPAATVLLLTPPPCDGERYKTVSAAATRGVFQGAGRGEARLKPYLLACREAATASGASLVELHDEWLAHPSTGASVGDAWKATLHDGLHPGPEGHAIIYKAVAAALERLGLGPLSRPQHRPGTLHRMYPALFDEEGRRAPRR